MLSPHLFGGWNVGDVWEEGEMMRLVKSNLAQRTEDNRVPYDNMLQMGQVRPELVVMDPNDSYVTSAACTLLTFCLL